MVSVPQSPRHTVESHQRVRRVLLGCGVVSSVWWVAVDIVASLRYPDYSYLDQTISELSAERAPTRPFLLAVNVVPYAVLTTAFGVGVWSAAGRTRAGRITGALLVGGAVIGMAGGILFPMMRRGTKGDLRNAMHAPYGAVSMLLFLVTMGYGSRLLGQRFRHYTYGTIGMWLFFGVLMSMQSGRMVADKPTPWMGLEERISVYAPMLWYVMLAVGLLRSEGITIPGQLGKPTATPQTMQRHRTKLPT